MSETLKYLYLLFDPDDEVFEHGKYVFTTEAHPIPLDLKSRIQMAVEKSAKTGAKKKQKEDKKAAESGSESVEPSDATEAIVAAEAGVAYAAAVEASARGGGGLGATSVSLDPPSRRERALRPGRRLLPGAGGRGGKGGRGGEGMGPWSSSHGSWMR